MASPDDLPPPPGPDRPLWEALHYAACTCSGYPDAAAVIADQLLVLADRIVPLEREPSDPKSATWIRWDARRQIRAALALEARRASNHPNN
jgi:hypothetical protein